MNIAVFYPKGNTAWSITKGVVNALRSMGHAVTDCGEDYNDHLFEDVIFVSGPEYLWRKLRETYPDWDKYKGIKVGWLHETVDREDYAANKIAVNGQLPLEALIKFTPTLYTPAIQDVKYGLKFLPFGVDIQKFHPAYYKSPDLEYTSLYTGSLYKKRRDFIEKYPEIRTLAAYRDYETVEEYAINTALATVILNLPSLSEASNTRTFEVLACRTALITPSMTHPDALFKHGKHLLYYDGSPATAFAELKEVAESIARQGYEEVVSFHTMQHRMKKVLEAIQRPLRTFRR